MINKLTITPEWEGEEEFDSDEAYGAYMENLDLPAEDANEIVDAEKVPLSD